MSIGQNHVFNILTPKSKALDKDQTLLKIQAKKADLGTRTPEGDTVKEYHPCLTESKCVSVPTLTDEVIVDSAINLIPHMRNLLDDARKEICKELILSGASSVADEQISVAAAIAYLDANVAGNRMTTELVSAWFTEYYADAALKFVSRKAASQIDGSLNDVQRAQAEKYVNALRGIFELFASPKYVPAQNHYTAVLNFTKYSEISEGDDSRMDKIVSRCVKAKEQMDELENVFS